MTHAAASLACLGIVLAVASPAASAPILQVRPTGEIPGVLVSRQLLSDLHLAIGDSVSLSLDPSGANARPFRIQGVYEPTPDPMKLTVRRLEARLHLSDLLALTADRTDPMAGESVDQLNVALADPTGAPRFATDLAARAPGLVVVPAKGGSGAASTFEVLGFTSPSRSSPSWEAPPSSSP